MKLAGKVAIVTGSARGIGRAFALRLASLGADVVITDLNLDGASQYGETLTAATVPDEIRALGRRSIGVQGDLTKQQDVQNVIDRTLAEFGRIDILVNNAGGAIAPVERSKASVMPQEDVDLMFKVNMTSTILCAQAVVPTMRAQHSGIIVNVSSMAGLYPAVRRGALAHYGMAKTAVIQFTRFLAEEVGPDGIRVNCLSPGSIATARIKALSAARNIGTSADEEQIPLRRLGTAEDCAGVLEFLTTDLSAYVSGQCISVCGGRVLTPS
ncbi:MAG: SDR family NAD(P)-dependent oxidoreductase [Janthinobacterium lividum]